MNNNINPSGIPITVMNNRIEPTNPANASRNPTAIFFNGFSGMDRAMAAARFGNTTRTSSPITSKNRYRMNHHMMDDAPNRSSSRTGRDCCFVRASVGEVAVNAGSRQDIQLTHIKFHVTAHIMVNLMYHQRLHSYPIRATAMIMY